MPIINEDPITIPEISKPAVILDELHVVRMFIDSQPGGAASAALYIRPWNRTTNDIGDEEALIVNDLWLSAYEVPEVGAALNAILNAINPLKNWLKSKES